MKNINIFLYLILFLFFVFLTFSECKKKSEIVTSTSTVNSSPSTINLTIYPDSVLNTFDVTNPVGINLNFFNDNDSFLNPSRKLSAALSEMGVKYLRYPGGDKSDYYFFSAPPFSEAIATPCQTGPGSNASRADFFNNDRTAYNRAVLNFDECMVLAREAGAEPVITCAIDTYMQVPDSMPGATTATKTSTRAQYLQNAVEWVRYANITHNYKIKYWMLGNETWVAYYQSPFGTWYGDDPLTYAKDLIDFSSAMKAVDPSIKIIANGVDWTVQKYLPIAANYIDYICTSNYPDKYNSYDDWVQQCTAHTDNLTTVMQNVLSMIDACGSISVSKKASLKVWASEFGPHDFSGQGWGNYQNLGKAMLNFDIIGQELSNPRFMISLFWNTRWMGHGQYYNYDALDDNNNFSPDGQTLALWNNFIYPQMIQTNSAAGFLTFATCDNINHSIYYYIINQKANAAAISLSIPNKSISSIQFAGEMKGDNPQSSYTTYFLNGKNVVNASNLLLDPYSISVFRISYK